MVKRKKTPAPKKRKETTPTIKKETTPTIKKVEDKNLLESLTYLKQNKLTTESKSQIKFSTVKEAEDSAKEDIVSTINEKLSSIKQGISELQKAGYELELYGIELLRIPLKTKVWEATAAKKDIEPIFQVLIKIETIVNKLLKEKEEKVAEKEKQEQEQEKQEAEEAKNKKPILETMIKPDSKAQAKLK